MKTMKKRKRDLVVKILMTVVVVTILGSYLLAVFTHHQYFMIGAFIALAVEGVVLVWL